MDNIQKNIQLGRQKQITQMQNANKKKVGIFANNFQDNFDPNTAEGLYNLAIQNGGRPGEVASLLARQDKRLFTTVGEGLKNVAMGALDLLATPGHLVAGTLLGLQDNGLTFGESVRKALKENINVSDVIMPNKLTTKDSPFLAKAGEWGLRFAIDVVTDPLTFVTAGATRGILGISGSPLITAQKNLAQKYAIREGGKLGLAEGAGDATKEFFNLTMSIKAAPDVAKKSMESLKRKGFTEKEINHVRTRLDAGDSFEDAIQGLGKKIDEEFSQYIISASKMDAAPKRLEAVRKSLDDYGIDLDKLDDFVIKNQDEFLKRMDTNIVNYDVASKMVSNLLEVAPELAPTIIDKGGLKFLGKTILEGVKIREFAQMIPGFKYMDNVTLPIRQSINSMFNTTLVNIGNGLFHRTPKEILDFQKQFDLYKKTGGQQLVDKVQKAFMEYGVNSAEEANMLTRQFYAQQVPADERTRKIFMALNDLDKDGYLAAKASGLDPDFLANRIPKIISKQDVAPTYNAIKHSTLSENIHQMNQKKFVTFENASDPSKKIIGATDSKEVDNLINLHDNLKSATPKVLDKTKLDTAISKQLSKIDETIAFQREINSESSERMIYELMQEKKNIKDGNLNNLYLDEQTNEIYTRRGMTVDELEEAGIQMNGFQLTSDDISWTNTLIQGSLQANNQIASKLFVDDIARFGTSIEHAPTGYRPLQSTVKNFTDEAGNELVFAPDMADHLDALLTQMNKAKPDSNAFLDAYDKASSVWKSSVTSISPAFHARNAFSNVLLNFADIGMNILNPSYYIKSGTIIHGRMKINDLRKKIAKATADSADTTQLQTQLYDELTKPIFTDSRGYSWTMGELDTEIQSRNVAYREIATDADLDQIVFGKKKYSDVLEESGKKSKKVYKKMRQSLPVFNDFFGYRYGRAFGNLVENHSRIMNFVANLDKTGDVALAATRTNQFLFDYSDLTKAERGILRRIIPFYSFSKFNLENQVRTMFSSPGRTMTQIHAQDTFVNTFSQDDLTDEQKKILPSWMKRGFYYIKKQKDGTYKSTSVLESMVHQPIDAWQPENLLGSMNPFIKMGIEQTTGYDLFLGKTFSEATNADAYTWAPKPIKDFIGFHSYEYEHYETGEKIRKNVSLRPSRLNLMNNLPPTSRVISSIKNLSSEKTTNDRIMRELFGFYYSDFDYEEQAKWEERKNKEMYENVLKTSGLIGQYKTNFVPKEK